MPDGTTSLINDTKLEIEALSGRVAATDSTLNNLQNQVLRLDQSFASQLREQSANFSGELKAIGEKIEAQGREFRESRQTSISGFLVTCAAVGGFLAIIGGALFYPMMKEQDAATAALLKLSENTVKREDFRDYMTSRKATTDALEAAVARVAEISVRREDFRAYVTENKADLEKIWTRMRTNEDASVSHLEAAEMDKRYVQADRNTSSLIEHLVKRIDDLEAWVVKRPEIEAANNAQNATVERQALALQQLRAQVEAMYPPSRTIDELFAATREARQLQLQLVEKLRGGPQPAPPSGPTVP